MKSILWLADVNKAERLISKVQAIISKVQAIAHLMGPVGHTDDVPSDTLGMAALAIDDTLQELSGVVSSRKDEQSAAVVR